MKKNVFWKVYIFFVVIAVAASVAAFALFWNFLAVYEKSQPKYVMESVISLFESGDSAELIDHMQYEVSAFENEETVVNYLNTILGTGEWKYKQNIETYNKDTEIFKIMKDNKAVATVTIQKSSERGRFNTDKWEFVSVDNMLVKNTYVVTAPTNATVYINGIKLTSEYAKENTIAITSLSNASKYVSVPGMIKYSIPDMLIKPQITATGGVFNSELTAKEDNLSTTFAFENNVEFNNSQESRIVEFTKKYGAYVTNEAKFSSLSSYVRGDSYAYTFLKGIESTNIWYPSHSAGEFVNLLVHDYQSYTADCFSCEVSFTLKFVSASKTYEYPTNLKYYFVKSNNVWYVADFVIK